MTHSPMPKPAPADDEKPHGDVLGENVTDGQSPGVGSGGGATVDGEPSTFEPEEDPQ